MSSWKNAHKAYQKPHRERHQPEARKHLGNLEKKKDYKLRANDYNAKKSELKYLHKRALDRNPDEFYYHMINSQVDEGLHKDKSKGIQLTPDQLQLMQTQDFKYVSTKHSMELKKIGKLRATLHNLDDGAPQNKHTFFVEDEKEKTKFRLAERLGTEKALLKRRYNRIRTEDLMKTQLGQSQGSNINLKEKIVQIKKDKNKSYKLLNQRVQRLEKMDRLKRKMELKRIIQDKKREIVKRIEPETPEAPPIYEFKQERMK